MALNDPTRTQFQLWMLGKLYEINHRESSALLSPARMRHMAPAAVWIRDKTFLCPCAPHAKLPQLEMLAGLVFLRDVSAAYMAFYLLQHLMLSSIYLRIKLQTFVALAEKNYF